VRGEYAARGGRLVAILWGQQWTREELLARVGRLEQVAGIRLTEGGDGAERGVRMLRCSTGAGFDFEIDARDRGELIHLAPGEARRYRLEVGALVGHDAVDAFAREADALAAGAETPA
jgi:hypothetical protein